jgi:hypothetical protein
VVGASAFCVHVLASNPCATTKTFSLGFIDPRFGLASSSIQKYAEEAAAVWNTSYATSTLFSYTPSGGDIVVTLIYDDRQRTTLQNEKIQETITTEKEQLDTLKQTIASIQEQYSELEPVIAEKTKAYNARLTQYNKEVAYWNGRGGAPNDTYERLNRESVNLERARAELNRDIEQFNSLAEKLRTYGQSHNQIVNTINSKVTTLNTTALREFEEGTYDPRTKTITIYEYASITALRRVLIHEFGHALSLDHVNDEDAIMYPINKGTNLTLTSADIHELNTVCRNKTIDDVRAIRDDIFHRAVLSWRDITAQLE